jgi:hypothetical protein
MNWQSNANKKAAPFLEAAIYYDCIYLIIIRAATLTAS